MSEPRAKRLPHTHPAHAIRVGWDRAQDNQTRRERQAQARAISSGKVRGGPSAESNARARRANASLALPPAEAEALARNHERIEERRTRRG